ncbi:MAG: hypothetical protein HY017_17980 [Betaproteobacteria bacterium]|nr:hypothetical protein [Betaproteobacteria bacterium]
MDTRQIQLNDLILAYLRYKNWMDYDTVHSAFCAEEIIVMQALFGTAYIKVPAALITASYEELLACMDKRQATLRMQTDAVYSSTYEDQIDDILKELEKSALKSELHYFTALHEATMRTAASARWDIEQESGKLALDKEPLEDYYEKSDEATIERIRTLIIAEHPEIESMSFPVEKLRDMGLPKQPPEPVGWT